MPAALKRGDVPPECRLTIFVKSYTIPFITVHKSCMVMCLATSYIVNSLIRFFGGSYLGPSVVVVNDYGLIVVSSISLYLSPFSNCGISESFGISTKLAIFAYPVLLMLKATTLLLPFYFQLVKLYHSMIE